MYRTTPSTIQTRVDIIWFGYVDATDEIHSGPYLKATVGEGTVRIPLTGGR